ncbi:Uncharacterised protein [Klebsiella pneumoniae]|nr:Uncharacterised protein [Klebsiella pneumoniae]VGC72466.1 Uncharacterised protein [Klebsiella pneumoniae]
MNPRNKIFKKNTTIPIISICNLFYINLLIFSGYLIVSDFFRTAYFVDQDLSQYSREGANKFLI